MTPQVVPQSPAGEVDRFRGKAVRLPLYRFCWLIPRAPSPCRGARAGLASRVDLA